MLWTLVLGQFLNRWRFCSLPSALQITEGFVFWLYGILENILSDDWHQLISWVWIASSPFMSLADYSGHIAMVSSTTGQSSWFGRIFPKLKRKIQTPCSWRTVCNHYSVCGTPQTHIGGRVVPRGMVFRAQTDQHRRETLTFQAGEQVCYQPGTSLWTLLVLSCPTGLLALF